MSGHKHGPSQTLTHQCDLGEPQGAPLCEPAASWCPSAPWQCPSQGLQVAPGVPVLVAASGMVLVGVQPPSPGSSQAHSHRAPSL